MAALRLLLQRYAEKMPRAEVEAMLESVFTEVRTSLGMPPQADVASPDRPTIQIAGWLGWAPLQRRLQLLRQDATQLALSSGAIRNALG
jgi:hypothetical protein